jgi:hypothetical protein
VRDLNFGAKMSKFWLTHANITKKMAHVLCMGAGVFENGKKEKEKGGVFV